MYASSLYAIKCVIVSKCVDSVDALLLRDDRVCRILPKLVKTAHEQLRWVNELPDSVFATFHMMLADDKLTMEDVIHEILLAVYIAMAMIHCRLFDLALSLPWSLAYGNIEENLKEFLAEEDPPPDIDPFTFKLWRLAVQMIGLTI